MPESQPAPPRGLRAEERGGRGEIQREFTRCNRFQLGPPHQRRDPAAAREIRLSSVGSKRPIRRRAMSGSRARHQGGRRLSGAFQFRAVWAWRASLGRKRRHLGSSPGMACRAVCDPLRAGSARVLRTRPRRPARDDLGQRERRKRELSSSTTTTSGRARHDDPVHQPHSTGSPTRMIERYQRRRARASISRLATGIRGRAEHHLDRDGDAHRSEIERL